MKHILSLILVSILVFTMASPILGAIHDNQDDFLYHGNGPTGRMIDSLTLIDNDIWFSADLDVPSFQFRLDTAQSQPTLYSIREYQNDQMFGNLNYLTQEGLKNARFSYLANSGFFLGLDYYPESNMDPVVTSMISPGYRFDFPGNQGYLALSADYRVEVPQDPQTVGYDLDFKCFFQNMKIVTQIYRLIAQFTQEIPDLNSPPPPGHNNFLIDLELDYKYSEELTLGTRLNGNSGGNTANSSSYEAGFTWIKPSFVLNGKFGRDLLKNSYRTIGGDYKLGKYFLGVKYHRAFGMEHPNITYSLTGVEKDSKMSITCTQCPGTPQSWNLIYIIKPYEGF